MKKSSWKFLCVAVCCLMTFFLMTGFTSTKTSLKVATWNILHGNGVLDAQQRQMGFLGDVIALQEVDEKTERVDGKSCLEILGKSKYYFRSFAKEMDYKGGEYGIGILSKHFLRGATSSLGTYGTLAQDGLMKVEVVKDDHVISVYNVHFSYESDSVRERQIKQAAELFAADPNRYKILMGDFNVKSLEEFAPFAGYPMLNTPETPLETYHGDDWDTKCLDNIIYTDTLSLRRSDMIVNQLSDHNALIAEFQMQ